MTLAGCQWVQRQLRGLGGWDIAGVDVANDDYGTHEGASQFAGERVTVLAAPEIEVPLQH